LNEPSVADLVRWDSPGLRRRCSSVVPCFPHWYWLRPGCADPGSS